MRGLTIRQKLTLWYGGVMAAILVGCGGSIQLMTQRHLLALIDSPLAEELDRFRDVVLASRSLSDLGSRLQQSYDLHDRYEFQVITERGKVLFRSRHFHLGIFSGPPHAESRAVSFVNLLYDHGHDVSRFRLASRVAGGPDGPLIVQSLASLQDLDRALGELRTVLLLIGPAALVVALVGGYLLARKALAPVDRMIATAGEITSKRLDRRLEAPNPDDELGRLAETLNGMIERLGRSIEEVRRFTADAAHELRTPLTLMRTEIEVALRDMGESAADAPLLERLLEEIDRLTRLVTQLLFLCREDAGLASREHQPVDLAEVVRKVVDHMQVVVEERGQALVIPPLASCRVRGDEDLLSQLFFNVFDNASKYTPNGGTISVLVDRGAKEVRIVIADTGAGIPAEHLPHVFDRFYRVDPSRSRETEGTGLGLAICRSIAQSHGGRLRIESVAGRGTSVILTIPGASP